MNAIASYKTRRLETASPHQIVVMLFQELQRRIELGARKLDDGKKGEAAPHFHHAREILAELLASLDPVPGSEELVKNLSGLYRWSVSELIAAGRDTDPARARAVSRAIQPVLEGFTELLVRSVP
ncbi:MAG: flagellar export chaperone FliS [Myxococcota bacterium]